MRESKSRGRKTRDNSNETNSASLQLELELTAVKAKNADLIKAHTKLVQENSELRNQIYSLQADIVDTQAKYNNLESVLKNVEQNMKKCTPNLIDILNLFLQVSDSRKNSFNMLNMSNSNTGFTSKTKAITHTVKPHTVNGTVLNLVPTISLTRLNTTSTNQRTNDLSSSSPHIDYRNSLPSTSTTFENNEENQDENLSPNLDNSEVENQSFVSRRKNTNSIPETHLNGSLGLEDDIDAEEQTSDESEPEEENIQRLSTIQEESICSSGRKRTSLGEVRIYLSRLSTEDLHVRRSQNTSFSSTEANVNDTCLNIETTVIENPDNRVSKRLRADIMVFSPHTNSTRVESDSSMFDELSPRDDRRKSSLPALSAIQSAEVTPNASLTNGTDELLTSNRMTWLPTPSLSALGDIDTSNTKLEILKELGLTPSPFFRPNQKADTMEYSSIPSSTTPQRYTRSSNKIQTRSHSRTDDESPRSSTENQNENRSVKSFVSKQRGVSGDRPLTPTIVLERLENILPQGITASSVNIQFVTQTDKPKENETPPKKRETRSKKGKAKTKSKSPKKSVKRRIKDDEQESGRLEEKIREIQIRLSNYIPDTSENNMEAPENNCQRPKRAARPTMLKDASLKVVNSREKKSSKKVSVQKCPQKSTTKLRRMF